MKGGEAKGAISHLYRKTTRFSLENKSLILAGIIFLTQVTQEEYNI